MIKRKCSICNKMKISIEFYPVGKDGFTRDCKKCIDKKISFANKDPEESFKEYDWMVKQKPKDY